ncbi:MAG TPA: hypothetical protein VF950_04110 [Planctomycetota bacterium]
MKRGSEVVYCFKCGTRLLGRDFEAAGALRFADFNSCSACARVLFGSLSVRRQKLFADIIERTYAASRRR